MEKISEICSPATVKALFGSMFFDRLKGLFHPASLEGVVTFSWAMKLATTNANQETARARHAG